MNRRTVRLIERRARVVKLPRADARHLAEHFSHVIEVIPGFDRRAFRLTPRGYIGFVDGPTRRFEIGPKVPWPAVLMLLGLKESPFPAGAVVNPAVALLGVLGRELAVRMASVTQGGLIRGYHDEDAESSFLRGRLRTAEQLRDSARGRTPDLFHITESAFDLDTPWNRIPKAVGTSLLSHLDLPAAVRDELAAALVPFEPVPLAPVSEGDFEVATRDLRAAAYNGLLATCRLIHDGLNAAGGAGERGAFLLDLGRAFERFVTESVAAAFANRPGWSVEPQPRLALGESTILQPDLLVRCRGAVRGVLDAKWKKPGPEPADLHQILAYAAVTGAKHVGLVYPGRRFARRQLALPDGRLRVSLFRLPMVGPVEACARSAAKLARSLVRPQQ